MLELGLMDLAISMPSGNPHNLVLALLLALSRYVYIEKLNRNQYSYSFNLPNYLKIITS